MNNCIRTKLCTQTWNNLFTHHSGHFLRNSRHRNKYLTIFLKPTDRSTPYPIINNDTIFRYHCLTFIQRIHRYFSGKHSFYVFKYFFTEYQFRMKVFTESLLGDIIFCRAQSSGHQDNIHPFHRIIYCLHDLFFAVTDGNDA